MDKNVIFIIVGTFILVVVLLIYYILEVRDAYNKKALAIEDSINVEYTENLVPKMQHIDMQTERVLQNNQLNKYNDLGTDNFESFSYNRNFSELMKNNHTFSEKDARALLST